MISRRRGATVYRARQLTMGRLVTLTVLSPSAAERPGLRARFEREVAVAARLRHENVISAIDAGQVRGYRYVVTEHVEGRTLAEAFAAGEQFDVDRALEIATEVAQALAHVQGLGLVHRNVTPSSIVITEAGHAKLAGFSLAKVHVAGSAETWHEADIDSAPYTAPELARGEKGVDIRADLYALGCVLFQLLAGRPPFASHSAATLIEMHLAEPPPDVRKFRADVPDAVVALLDRMLRKDRRERHPRADALVKDLEALRGACAAPQPSPRAAPTRRLPGLRRRK